MIGQPADNRLLAEAPDTAARVLEGTVIISIVLTWMTACKQIGFVRQVLPLAGTP